MCIIFLDYSPDRSSASKPYQLIVAANRDEFYDRHSIPARFWPEPSAAHVIAGKDALKGGTWLGFSKHGRFAALTNHRKQYGSNLFDGKSRGKLVLDYLTQLQDVSPTEYATQVMTDASSYDGFNLIIGQLGKNAKEIVYCSNRSDMGVCPLVGGVYGLSNATLDTPWSKVTEGKKKFHEIINSQLDRDELTAQLVQLLNNETCYYPDPQVHCTDHPEHWMRGMSSIFARVPGEQYGTRTNTVILVDWEGMVSFTERTMAEPIKEGNITWITTSETFKVDEL